MDSDVRWKFLRQADDSVAEEGHGGNFGNYMRHKNAKLRQQFHENNAGRSGGVGSNLFSGVTIHVNGFTVPSHQELKQLMAIHGGGFENYYSRSRVTHIVCSNLPDTKIKQFRLQRDPVPFVRPEWITSSINAGTVLPITDFRLERLDDPRQRLLKNFSVHHAPTLQANEVYPVLKRQQPCQQHRQPVEPCIHIHGVPGHDTCRESHPCAEDEHHGCLHPDARMEPIDRSLTPVQRDEVPVSAPAPQAGWGTIGGCADTFHDSREVNPGQELGQGLDLGEGVNDGVILEGAELLAIPGNDATKPAATSDTNMENEQRLGTQASSDTHDLDDQEEEHMSDFPSAGPCLQLPSESKACLEPGNDSSLQRAQEIAAAKRAACDLLKGPVQSSRAGPQFMETFFKSSRLHFIGTWRNRIETLAAQLVSTAPMPSKGKSKREGGSPERSIIHLDMDCFFASAAAVGNPELQGKPLAVCHSNSSKGTAEVSAANYEARAFGIQAGTFIAKAKELCPELIVVPYEFEKYQSISEKVYRLCLQHTACVQPISCDEAYLDITGLGDPEDIAQRLRASIELETGCRASSGIGPNLLLARLATKLAKPNGQLRVAQKDAMQFLAGKSVSDIPGVGWSLQKRLAAMGVEEICQVWSLSKPVLQQKLGQKTGSMVWDYAHGIDPREVTPPQGRKSIGAECSWGIRFSDFSAAETFLKQMAREVSDRLKQAGVRGRCITLKMKRRRVGAPEPGKFLGHGICDNLSRSLTAGDFFDEHQDIFERALTMLKALRVPPQEIRGIGITLSKLDTDASSIHARPSAPAPSKAEAPMPNYAFDTKKPHPWMKFDVQARKEANGRRSVPTVDSPESKTCGASKSEAKGEMKGGHPAVHGPIPENVYDVCKLWKLRASIEDSLGCAASDAAHEGLRENGTAVDPVAVDVETGCDSDHGASQQANIGAENSGRAASAAQVNQGDGEANVRPAEANWGRCTGSRDVCDMTSGDKPADLVGSGSKGCGAERTNLTASSGGVNALPPASQLDEAVLDALPLVVKREIENAYTVSRAGRSPVRRKRGRGRRGRGTGGLQRNKAPKKMRLDEGIWNKLINEDRKCGLTKTGSMTLTQVDPIILAELPATLRQEVVEGLPKTRNGFLVEGNARVPPFCDASKGAADGAEATAARALGSTCKLNSCTTDAEDETSLSTRIPLSGERGVGVDEVKSLLEGFAAFEREQPSATTVTTQGSSPCTTPLGERLEKFVAHVAEWLSQHDPWDEVLLECLNLFKKTGNKFWRLRPACHQMIDMVQSRIERLHGFKLNLRSVLDD
eukprot:evm.model.scf_1084.2 EVM.evm.TU.scf_1084.2   scf_1084:6744-14924(+)